MKLDDAFPSKYLKCSDLEGQEWPVKIEKYDLEDFENDGQKQRKLVLYFRDPDGVSLDKGFVCNRTNADAIADRYGQDLDSWIAREVILYPATATFQGKSMPAIRIRIPAPTRQPSRVQTSPRAMAAQPLPDDPPPWEPEGR